MCIENSVNLNINVDKMEIFTTFPFFVYEKVKQTSHIQGTFKTYISNSFFLKSISKFFFNSMNRRFNIFELFLFVKEWRNNEEPDLEIFQRFGS